MTWRHIVTTIAGAVICVLCYVWNYAPEVRLYLQTCFGAAAIFYAVLVVVNIRGTFVFWPLCRARALIPLLMTLGFLALAIIVGRYGSERRFAGFLSRHDQYEQMVRDVVAGLDLESKGYRIKVSRNDYIQYNCPTQYHSLAPMGVAVYRANNEVTAVCFVLWTGFGSTHCGYVYAPHGNPENVRPHHDLFVQRQLLPAWYAYWD